MKRSVLVFVLLTVVLLGVNAFDFNQVRNIDTIKMTDQSEENPALIIGTVDVSLGFFGEKLGPAYLSFVKVQPLVGRRFLPKRDGRLVGDTRLFFFDNAKVGESFKLYDMAWSVSTGQFVYSYVVAPGIAGDILKVSVTKPGIYVIGAYSYRQGFVVDYELNEVKILEMALANLGSFPKWKALVEARLKEIKK